MARLDIRRTRQLRGVLFVMELQAELLVDLDTVVIAPLVDIRRLPPLAEVNPVFDIEGQTFALRLEQMISLPRKYLGGLVSNALPDEYRVMRGLDRLLSRT